MAEASGDRSATLLQQQARLLTWLLMIDIVGQRLCLPLGSTNQVPIGLIAGIVVPLIGVRRGLLILDRARLRLAMLAALALALSTELSLASGRSFSLLSLGYLLLTYVPFVTLARGDGRALLIVLLGRFTTLMSVLAGLGLGLTLVQFVGGPGGDLLGQVLPHNILISGYHTTYPFSYGSPYDKSNALVFLEPSFCCQFLGAALLAHLWLRRTGFRPLLFLAAMVLTVAGTGFLLLGAGLVALAGSRRALSRGNATLLKGLIPAIGAGLLLAVTTPLGNLFLSRLTEGTSGNSSTGERFFQPFATLGNSWLDGVSDTLFGRGPGAATHFLAAYGNSDIVPLSPLKLLFEYGAAATVPMLVFVFWSCTHGAHSPPLTAGLLTAWLLLSGSLQQPATVLLLWLFTSACARPSRLVLAPRQASTHGSAGRPATLRIRPVAS